MAQAAQTGRDPVRRALLRLTLLVIAASMGANARAQKDQNFRTWWVGGSMGEGQLKLSSDQHHRGYDPMFALAFFGGHRLGSRARAGVEINGWLLQAFDLNDPTVGESVSNVWGLVDAFPSRRIPWFVRAGGGLASYTNNRPSGHDGRGWSWTAGSGYEFRLNDTVALAPVVAYAYGTFNNAGSIETGRRYSVVEFKLAAICHFGHAK